MEIVERIKDNFNRGFFGKSMVIPELPEEFPAWTLKAGHCICHLFVLNLRGWDGVWTI